jgi:hypothetical protein
VSGKTPEVDDPAVQAVLDGRDEIVLDEDLLAETEIIADAGAGTDASGDSRARLERREAMPARIRKMPVAERFKLGLRGNLEARNVLARDPLKLVQSAVLKNPRITVEEVLNLAKSRSVDGDLLRQVGSEKEWVRHYTVRQALVQNPKTPVNTSLLLIRGMRERDIRTLARSKNVPGVIQQAARRLVLQRDR